VKLYTAKEFDTSVSQLLFLALTFRFQQLHNSFFLLFIYEVF